jgi:hypothetical protein
VEHLGAVAQRLAEARRAERHQHELLQVDLVVRVRAAVDHVHQRHRQLHLARAAEVAVERKRRLLGRGLGDRAGDGEDRVGAEARLVVGAVERDQRLVDEALLGGVEPQDRLADLGVDVLDRAHDALAEVALRVAVAQLDRFLRARRRAGRHGRAARVAGLEDDVGLDRGVAARIEDLAGDDVDDGAHVLVLKGQLVGGELLDHEPDRGNACFLAHDRARGRTVPELDRRRDRHARDGGGVGAFDAHAVERAARTFTLSIATALYAIERDCAGVSATVCVHALPTATGYCIGLRLGHGGGWTRLPGRRTRAGPACEVPSSLIR